MLSPNLLSRYLIYNIRSIALSKVKYKSSFWFTWWVMRWKLITKMQGMLSCSTKKSLVSLKTQGNKTRKREHTKTSQGISTVACQCKDHWRKQCVVWQENLGSSIMIFLTNFICRQRGFDLCLIDFEILQQICVIHITSWIYTQCAHIATKLR